MALEITKEIKEDFEEFCKAEFKNCLYISNKNNNKQWLYVQVSKDLPHCIYYKFSDNKVHLHIETDDIELNKFIKDYLEDKTGKSFSTQKKNSHSFTYEKALDKKEDIIEAFKNINCEFSTHLNSEELKSLFLCKQKLYITNIDNSKNKYFYDSYHDLHSFDWVTFFIFLFSGLAILSFLLMPYVFPLIHGDEFQKFSKLKFIIKTPSIIFTIIFISILSSLTIKKIFNNKYKIKKDKISLLNKIYNEIKNKKTQSFNTTIKYNDNEKETVITSSDQQTKVLIAAIEAIKDL